MPCLDQHGPRRIYGETGCCFNRSRARATTTASARDLCRVGFARSSSCDPDLSTQTRDRYCVTASRPYTSHLGKTVSVAGRAPTRRHCCPTVSGTDMDTTDKPSTTLLPAMESNALQQPSKAQQALRTAALTVSPENVIAQRSGDVLIKHTVLKADHFPSKSPSSLYQHGLMLFWCMRECSSWLVSHDLQHALFHPTPPSGCHNTKLTPIMDGAPNFRKVMSRRMLLMVGA